jgi:hypothetical protein
MIKRVKCSDWLESVEAQPLIAEYTAECSIPSIGPINPQPATYAAMERANLMQSFAAYDGTDLAGFANLLTPVLPHYGLQVGTTETLFMAKQFCFGRELIQAIEDYAAEVGCVGILHSAPIGGRFERFLNASKHYQRTNSVFYRRLA